MSWYKVRMSVDDIAQGKHVHLQNAFESIFRVMGTPADAAMFGNRDVAEDYTYFFSPGAAILFFKMLTSLKAVKLCLSKLFGGARAGFEQFA